MSLFFKSVRLLPLVRVTQVPARAVFAARFQSIQPLKAEAKVETLEQEYDRWIADVKAAREIVQANPPGLMENERLEEAVGWKPSEAQLEEFEKVRELPIPARDDPVITHVTNMIMKNGKKALAEKILSRALYMVYLKLRKDPVEVLKKCIEDLAPLMVVKSFKTGFAKKLNVPVPLKKRQRQRLAISWILEGAVKRNSHEYAVKLGEEIVAVSQGRGSGYDKRTLIHKSSISHRSYIKLR
ncbi:hypothetical protein BABINDRAFT_39378 [Babjeviella inositovora NRRL Y-12698]|uniref:Small ribosomal subunit protein uS7m n=1 Tax=Babjeviella inositovora NRRL Y-12698 TaxID=984486 RepID=A0A1E3QL67_9ASCO|nr:uncharacterized protein BABINDRAFT_39378 [Babjeviella inositovora NRRL Y-12698]ODQ78358.1 hypothetical protein BABINDRAFT_39378 [Babjeviella inositovora NRRL Y-12698]